MTHHVTTIEGHTVAITGPDADGLAQKLKEALTGQDEGDSTHHRYEPSDEDNSLD